ncbi:ATPase [Sphingobacteriaceae bacterium]|nr:ATPase [Sphingobacteriaceae bacterium]
MKRENYTYSFETSKTAHEVYELLLDIKKWWSGLYEEIIAGKSKKPGDEFNFKAGGGMHDTTQKLVELIPDKKIVWLVTKSQLSFLSDPSEWTNTKLCFDIEPKGNKTRVTFTHEGLTPQIECYTNCSTAWTGYLDNLNKALK